MSLFNFSRGEWRATLFLVILILAALSLSYPFNQNTANRGKYHHDEFSAKISAFYTEQELILDSIQKIYEKRDEYYSKNREYISDFQSNLDTGKKRPSNFKQNNKPKYDIVKLDLNSCDSIDVLNVPMFGSKRAQKLVEYREQLGGFYSINQVREIYVLQDIEDELLLTYFYIDKSKIRKLNVNTASYQDLVKHPYLDSYLTKIIVNYRQRNGKIENLEQFQKITHVYNELLQQLAPYLLF